MIKKNELTEIIKWSASEWIYDTNFVSYWDINSGSCGEFALYIQEQLPKDSGMEIVTTGSYLKGNGLYFGEEKTHSNHVWITLNGDHFDIERPEGVSNFMELPFFQREIEMKRIGITDQELYKLIDESPEKYRNLIFLPK